jgi:hypothetical protein
MSNNINKTSVQKIVASYNRMEEAKLAIQALNPTSNPIPTISSIVDTLDSIDSIVKRPLANYIEDSVVAKWASSQFGIGPVLSAGLLSHIDIVKAHTPGAVWRYAGLDPSSSNKKIFNGDLKSICWKIGSNFAKHASKPNCFYGKLYLQDKERRIKKNNEGLYADKAKDILSDLPYKFRSDVSLLKQGKLSDEQIDAQARRFAVKIFLSHYYAIAYQEQHGTTAVRPSHITINGEKQYIEIPNNPFDK